MAKEWSFAGWYHRRGGVLVGPLAARHIRRLVASGRLRPSDRVWERWQCGHESLMVPALASTACAAGGVPLTPPPLCSAPDSVSNAPVG
jgi:hypothetical protein